MGLNPDGASPAPRSWAEDLNSYRSTRGSKSLSTLADAGGAPERYSRTNYVPFLDTRHPLFPYNDFQDGKGTIRVDPTTTTERYERHGWGDTSLLKEEGYAGVPHPRSGPEHPTGKARPVSPRAADGRSGLFGVMQMTEAGQLDSWIGHPLVNPAKGKRHVDAPADTRGRRDLFDVLHARAKGTPSDDSWLGNQLIDPSRGKAHPPGPEQIRGRRDLTDVFSMSIMQDPRRLELLQKGADPLGDAWCGHRLIDPARGKLPASNAASEAHLHGATFKPATAPPGAPPHSDLPRRHNRFVPAPVEPVAPALLKGQPVPVDPAEAKLGRRSFPDHPPPNRFDGRKDLYAHMTFRPLTGSEQIKYSRAFDDSGVTGKHASRPPASADTVMHGPDMLTWRPEVRVGQFVPRGGLAQEARANGSTLRGTRGR